MFSLSCFLPCFGILRDLYININHFEAYFWRLSGQIRVCFILSLNTLQLKYNLPTYIQNILGVQKVSSLASQKRRVSSPVCTLGLTADSRILHCFIHYCLVKMLMRWPRNLTLVCNSWPKVKLVSLHMFHQSHKQVPIDGMKWGLTVFSLQLPVTLCMASYRFSHAALTFCNRSKPTSQQISGTIFLHNSLLSSSSPYKFKWPQPP